MLDPLRLACTRVETVTKIHDLLHAQGSMGALEFGAYVRVLCASSAKALGADGRAREIAMEIQPVTMTPAAAQALASPNW